MRTKIKVVGEGNKSTRAKRHKSTSWRATATTQQYWIGNARRRTRIKLLIFVNLPVMRAPDYLLQPAGLWSF